MSVEPFNLTKKDQEEVSSSNETGIADTSRRLRTIEGRYSNLERRSQVIEKNMLGGNRKLRAELKLLNEEMSEFKTQIAEMGENIEALAKELQNFARIEDVEVIKKYMNLFEPLDFVTQRELDGRVNQIIDDRIEKKKEQIIEEND
jgi:signal transduction histidine kinase